jgi:spore coat polysaccharide biosynthesis protein SpsF
MGSTRLPGKSMMPLAGKPLVGRILERVKRCRAVNVITLATTQHTEDDVLADLARSYDVQVYRGAEIDLVDRLLQAARAVDVELVARLPADNPVPEPTEIDRIIRYHLTGAAEFSSNLAQVLGNGYPDGIGAEVFNVSVLEDIWRSVADPTKREHPHLNFFDYKSQRATAPQRYRVGTVPCPEAFRRPDLVLDVNTREEYEFVAELYDYLYPRNPVFHITDIITWYDTIYRPSRS